MDRFPAAAVAAYYPARLTSRGARLRCGIVAAAARLNPLQNAPVDACSDIPEQVVNLRHRHGVIPKVDDLPQPSIDLVD